MADMLEDYKTLPYHSMPFPQTQPAYLAALASLHSLNAPAIETANVLELGCAAGGNIIPLAARFPKSHFEGVDLSPRHIADGEVLIQKLKLDNIKIQIADIADLHVAERKYDYIICHGVFSWAPKSVQDAIFDICNQGLSDKGLAYISYNVLPGWHSRLSVRDICLQFTEEKASAQDRVTQARGVLETYSQLVDGKTPFGAALQGDVKRSVSMSDSHFHGEFLSDCNDPSLFADFISRGSKQDLKYVCDAAPAESHTETIAPDRKKALSALYGKDLIAHEQALDFATGRAFRRSILTRSGNLEPKVSDAQLELLHLSSTLEVEAIKGGTYKFHKDTAKLSTNDPVIGHALSTLSKAYPETLSFPELFQLASKHEAGSAYAMKDRLKAAMTRLIMAGHVIPSTKPLKCAKQNEDSPTLWRVALAQIEEDQAWVSSQLHTPVKIEGPARFLARMMTGRKSIFEITENLKQAMKTGQLTIGEDQSDADPTEIASRLDRLIGMVVKDFRKKGLLTP